MNDTAPLSEADTIPLPFDTASPVVPSGRAGGDGGDGRAGRAAPRGDADGGGAATGPARGSFYRDAWRHVPRDLGYLAVTAVLLGTVYLVLPRAILSFIDPFWSPVANPVAIVLFFVTLFVARWLGSFERLRIGWAEPRPIRPVDWTPRWQQNWATRILSAVANPHYWLYLLHSAVVYPLAALVTIGVGAALTVGFFGPLVAGTAALLNGWRINLALEERGYDPTPTWILAAALCAVSMIVSAVLFPLWTRGATLAHYWIDHALLGGFKSDVLERRVVTLQQSRAGAVSAEGQALRRIERDLHDGPQQRLVRLRMDLAAAERALDTDPARARILIGEASGHAQDTLDELRALSRGFAPPILLDRGLIAALEALASRMTVPTTLGIRLPEGLVLPTEVERNLYFTVSELLTNVTKHAGASRADVVVRLVQDFYGGNVLAVTVADDGRGGATLREGHGIEGLTGRMRALDGDLTVSSPQGGPTEATARVPLLGLHGIPTDPTGASGTGAGAVGSPAVPPAPAE